jgi:hypothetical protein
VCFSCAVLSHVGGGDTVAALGIISKNSEIKSEYHSSFSSLQQEGGNHHRHHHHPVGDLHLHYP